MYNRLCLLGFGGMSFLAGAFYIGCAYWIYKYTHYPTTLFSVVAALLAISAIMVGIGLVVRYRQVTHL